VGAGVESVTWAVVNIDAILYENRSHYYYGVTMLQCNSEQQRRSC